MYKFDKSMDDDKRTTKLLVYTDKDRKILYELKDNLNRSVVSPDELTRGAKEMFRFVTVSEKRSKIMEDTAKIGGRNYLKSGFRKQQR